MASSSHVSNVTVNVTLQALATPGAGFGTVTLMVDEAQGTGNGLDGDRYIDFADVDEAQTARDAGYISAEVMAACTTAFTLDPAPSKFRVCRVDTGGAETYTSAYNLLLDEAGVQGDLYGFCMDSRTGATQEALGVTIEATDHFLYLQSSDAEITAAADTFPTAMADMEEYTQVGGCLHDTDSDWEDVAAMVQWLTPDPDLYSNPGEGDLKGVGDYATFLTATERTNAISNNFGVLGTWGSTDTWLHPMVSFDGRPVYENLTAAWLKARIEERIQTLIQREHQANRKVLCRPPASVRSVPPSGMFWPPARTSVTSRPARSS